MIKLTEVGHGEGLLWWKFLFLCDRADSGILYAYHSLTLEQWRPTVHFSIIFFGRSLTIGIDIGIKYLHKKQYRGTLY